MPLPPTGISGSTIGGRFRDWGFPGAASSFGEGIMSGLGFSKVSTGRISPMTGSMGLGVPRTTSRAVNTAMGNINSRYKFLPGKGMLSKGMGLMGPAFVGHGMYQGYKEGGLSGALTGGAMELATWGAFSVGTKALGVAFKGTAIKGFASGSLRLIKHPLVATAALAGFGAYKVAKGLAKVGHSSRESEFIGSMKAFDTQAAYTMRQRALQEINRSHTNARTILSNEAQYMHLR